MSISDTYHEQLTFLREEQMQLEDNLLTICTNSGMDEEREMKKEEEHTLLSTAKDPLPHAIHSFVQERTTPQHVPPTQRAKRGMPVSLPTRSQRQPPMPAVVMAPTSHPFPTTSSPVPLAGPCLSSFEFSFPSQNVQFLTSVTASGDYSRQETEKDAVRRKGKHPRASTTKTSATRVPPPSSSSSTTLGRTRPIEKRKKPILSISPTNTLSPSSPPSTSRNPPTTVPTTSARPVAVVGGQRKAVNVVGENALTMPTHAPLHDENETEVTANDKQTTARRASNGKHVQFPLDALGGGRMTTTTRGPPPPPMVSPFISSSSSSALAGRRHEQDRRRTSRHDSELDKGEAALACRPGAAEGTAVAIASAPSFLSTPPILPTTEDDDDHHDEPEEDEEESKAMAAIKSATPLTLQARMDSVKSLKRAYQTRAHQAMSAYFALAQERSGGGDGGRYPIPTTRDGSGGHVGYLDYQNKARERRLANAEAPSFLQRERTRPMRIGERRHLEAQAEREKVVQDALRTTPKATPVPASTFFNAYDVMVEEWKEQKAEQRRRAEKKHFAEVQRESLRRLSNERLRHVRETFLDDAQPFRRSTSHAQREGSTGGGVGGGRGRRGSSSTLPVRDDPSRPRATSAARRASARQDRAPQAWPLPPALAPRFSHAGSTTSDGTVLAHVRPPSLLPEGPSRYIDPVAPASATMRDTSPQPPVTVVASHPLLQDLAIPLEVKVGLWPALREHELVREQRILQRAREKKMDSDAYFQATMPSLSSSTGSPWRRGSGGEVEEEEKKKNKKKNSHSDGGGQWGPFHRGDPWPPPVVSFGIGVPTAMPTVVDASPASFSLAPPAAGSTTLAPPPPPVAVTPPVPSPSFGVGQAAVLSSLLPSFSFSPVAAAASPMNDAPPSSPSPAWGIGHPVLTISAGVPRSSSFASPAYTTSPPLVTGSGAATAAPAGSPIVLSPPFSMSPTTDARPPTASPPPVTLLSPTSLALPSCSGGGGGPSSSTPLRTAENGSVVLSHSPVVSYRQASGTAEASFFEEALQRREAARAAREANALAQRQAEEETFHQYHPQLRFHPRVDPGVPDYARLWAQEQDTRRSAQSPRKGTIIRPFALTPTAKDDVIHGKRYIPRVVMGKGKGGGGGGTGTARGRSSPPNPRKPPRPSSSPSPLSGTSSASSASPLEAGAGTTVGIPGSPSSPPSPSPSLSKEEEHTSRSAGDPPSMPRGTRAHALRAQWVFEHTLLDKENKAQEEASRREAEVLRRRTVRDRLAPYRCHPKSEHDALIRAKVRALHAADREREREAKARQKEMQERVAQLPPLFAELPQEEGMRRSQAQTEEEVRELLKEAGVTEGVAEAILSHSHPSLRLSMDKGMEDVQKSIDTTTTTADKAAAAVSHPTPLSPPPPPVVVPLLPQHRSSAEASRDGAGLATPVVGEAADSATKEAETTRTVPSKERRSTTTSSNSSSSSSSSYKSTRSGKSRPRAGSSTSSSSRSSSTASRRTQPNAGGNVISSSSSSSSSSSAASSPLPSPRGAAEVADSTRASSSMIRVEQRDFIASQSLPQTVSTPRPPTSPSSRRSNTSYGSDSFESND